MDIDKILDFKTIEKPTRYIGGEVGSVLKEDRDNLIRFVFAFPDLYEIGMSHLGLQILYRILNNREDTYCERTFMPAMDMRERMINQNIPLFTIESKTNVGSVDILGFTLQYEMSYTNILDMLKLSNIPFLASERGENHPLIIAGGPCTVNPEPLAEIIDVFFIGEAEELIEEFMDLYQEYKLNKQSRAEFLDKASKLDGIYIPVIHYPNTQISPNQSKKIVKRIVKDLNSCFQLTKPIIPFMNVVHDRAVQEIFRGCTKGCRFCQAGMIYRPVREKSKQTIVDNAVSLIENTGYEEISLSSLSTLDHSEIQKIVPELIDKGLSVSLPSLRLDSTSVPVLTRIQESRKTGLTFAPEAGTQRLRDVINKGITDENIKSTFKEIFSLGWSRVKLYFMIGLPTETDEDLKGISEIANLCTYLFKTHKPDFVTKSIEVSVSVSCFVPKPFTPFQWMSQNNVYEYYEKIDTLKKYLTNKKVKFSYHDPKLSFIEGIFARGDRKLTNALIRAYELGCIMDGWDEHFRYDLWIKAFEEVSIDPNQYTTRARDFGESLPWDIIDVGVDKDFLIEEYKKALKSETTIDCREGCIACGINEIVYIGDCPCIM